MNKEIKEKWVSALRSGNYTQGTGYLKQGDVEKVNIKHCCLGVLCELYREEHNADLQVTTTECDNYGLVYAFDGSYGVLPITIEGWANVGSTNILVLKNDTGSSFHEIADYIDENY